MVFVELKIIEEEEQLAVEILIIKVMLSLSLSSVGLEDFCARDEYSDMLFSMPVKIQISN